MKSTQSITLNKCNSGRAKIYYQLNQLQNLTGLSIRSLKYRMKDVKEKYRDIPALLCKVGRTWQIHYTIINEFLPIYNKSHSNVLNHKWETITTWNMRDSYDEDYHNRLVDEVQKAIPDSNIAYVIEKDGRGANHVHAIADKGQEQVEVAVNNVLGRYLDKKDYRLQVQRINNISSTVSYLLKNGGIRII